MLESREEYPFIALVTVVELRSGILENRWARGESHWTLGFLGQETSGVVFRLYSCL